LYSSDKKKRSQPGQQEYTNLMTERSVLDLRDNSRQEL
jgi:hypothetical protein